MHVRATRISGVDVCVCEVRGGVRIGKLWGPGWVPTRCIPLCQYYHVALNCHALKYLRNPPQLSHPEKLRTRSLTVSSSRSLQRKSIGGLTDESYWSLPPCFLTLFRLLVPPFLGFCRADSCHRGYLTRLYSCSPCCICSEWRQLLSREAAY